MADEPSLIDPDGIASLRHTLGVFDTAGPALLSSPRHALYYSSKALGRVLQERTGTAEEAYNRSGAAFWLPLGYLSEEEMEGQTIMVGGDVSERVINGAVFAHEAHHFLNVCSNPIGHLLHLAQTTLSMACANVLQRLDGFEGVETMPLPWATAPLHSFHDARLRDHVSALRAQHVIPFMKLHRALSGTLDMGPVADGAAATPGIEAVVAYYALLDRLCGSSLASCLDGVVSAPPLLICVGQSRIVAQLGSLQLAEFIGWSGEGLWLAWVRRLFAAEEATETSIHAQVDASVKRLFSRDRQYQSRYHVPMMIARTILGKDSGPTPPLFAAWMALLTPLDPRTLHLVSRYGMGWRDLHPGYRFLRILEAVKARPLIGAETWIEFRPSAAQNFDMVAETLGWPRFEELVAAMDTQHAIEEHGLFKQLRDPYGTIYTKINGHRRTHPWCDIVPGGEFFHDDPLSLPVVVSGGTLSVCDQVYGTRGLMMFSLARIAELMIFGDRGPLVGTLFTGGETDRVVDALCESVGFSFAHARNAWRRLQDEPKPALD